MMRELVLLQGLPPIACTSSDKANPTYVIRPGNFEPPTLEIVPEVVERPVGVSGMEAGETRESARALAERLANAVC
jgi:hypothetical protein